MNWSRLYRKYIHDIYPRIEGLRGATRVIPFLERKAHKDLPEFKGTPKSLDMIDFDNLIILDGCRFDTYREVTGSETHRISTGSSSKEVVENNFSGGDWKDTVVITANPYFSDSFFKNLTDRDLEEVFHTVFKLFENEWSEDEGTVPPDRVTKAALTAEKLFPEKRKIIWYMQPHNPFLGSDLQEAPGFKPEMDGSKGETVWDLAEKGVYSKEEVYSGYKENLKIVLKEVEKLAEELEGKTVLTSDHGNLVGEKGLYGHPAHKDAESLRKVPMDELEES